MNVLLWIWIIIKTILLILLCIAALLLIASALVLLIPVRYKIDGAYDKQFRMTVTAFWFFRLVRFIYQMENNETDLELKVLGRYLIGGADAQTPKREPANTTSDDTASVNTVADDTPSPGPVPGDHTAQAVANEEPRPETKHDTSDEDKKAYKSEPEHHDDNEHPNLKSKLDQIADQCINAVEKVKLVIGYPDRDALIKLTIQLIKRWIKALKADRFRLEGEFGFEDPSLTGKCLGGMAILCGLFGLVDAVHVVGNFEKSVMAFTLNGKGRFTLWSLLWPLVAFVLSKPVWKIIKPLIFKNKNSHEDKEKG